MAGIVTVKGRLTFPKKNLDALIKGFDEHVQLSRAEPGCIVFDYTRVKDRPELVDIFEQYNDMAAFEAHKTRLNASPWAGLSSDVARELDISEAG